MSKPWSKLKSRIEALWVPSLNMSIHTTSYTHSTTHDTYDIPRHWIVMDKEIIWDFPFPFIGDNASKRGETIPYYDHAYFVTDHSPKPIEPIHHHFLYNRAYSSVVAITLRNYLDCPKDKLFEEFPHDKWELGDMLRAADSRIGRNKLSEWVKTLDADHPALKIITKRNK